MDALLQLWVEYRTGHDPVQRFAARQQLIEQLFQVARSACKENRPRFPELQVDAKDLAQDAMVKRIIPALDGKRIDRKFDPTQFTRFVVYCLLRDECRRQRRRLVCASQMGEADAETSILDVPQLDLGPMQAAARADIARVMRALLTREELRVMNWLYFERQASIEDTATACRRGHGWVEQIRNAALRKLRGSKVLRELAV